jgi:hypothetical protein
MTLHRAGPLALACALVAGGCSGDDDGGGPPATALQYCQRLAAALAEAEARCQPADAASLESTLARALDCAGLQRAGEAGHFAYLGALAQPCLDALDELSCHGLSQASGPPPECWEPFSARVEPGGECFSELPVECAGGWCSVADCGAPGACVAWLGPGAACSSSARCAPGLECVAAACAVAAPPSELGEGGACASGNVICGAGLYCDRMSVPSTCRSRLTSGSCHGPAECAVGHDCVNGACAPERNAGAACAPGAGECVDGLWCDASSRCARWSGVGGACGTMPGGERSGCLGSWCEPAPAGSSQPGTCRAYLALGAACPGAAREECGPGAACDGGTCVRSYCIGL